MLKVFIVLVVKTVTSAICGGDDRELKLSGKVMYNGERLSKQTKRKVGFVLQVGWLCGRPRTSVLQLRLTHSVPCIV